MSGPSVALVASHVCLKSTSVLAPEPLVDVFTTICSARERIVGPSLNHPLCEFGQGRVQQRTSCHSVTFEPSLLVGHCMSGSSWPRSGQDFSKAGGVETG